MQRNPTVSVIIKNPDGSIKRMTYRYTIENMYMDARRIVYIEYYIYRQIYNVFEYIDNPLYVIEEMIHRSLPSPDESLAPYESIENVGDNDYGWKICLYDILRGMEDKQKRAIQVSD